jgi:hypothetical protein
VTKDGLREKVKQDLKRLYDDTLYEPIPAAMQELLDKLP